MPKPPLQFTRPSRPARAGDEVGLRPAASPAINLESPEVQAFSMRGRITVPVLQDSETRTSPQPEVASDPESRVVPDETEIADPWRHVAVKLPALSGQSSQRLPTEDAPSEPALHLNCSKLRCASLLAVIASANTRRLGALPLAPHAPVSHLYCHKKWQTICAMSLKPGALLKHKYLVGCLCRQSTHSTTKKFFEPVTPLHYRSRLEAADLFKIRSEFLGQTVSV